MDPNSLVLAVIEPEVTPQDVVLRAAWLAKITGSKLELLLCDPDVSALSDTIFVSNEARDIAADIRTAQLEMIDDLAAPARELGLEVATSVLDERPIADGVVYIALDRNPRFVVKGTQYHSEAQRAIFVDTDWQLIRSCPFPLWLVKPHRMAEKPLVIAAVDPTHSHDEVASLDQLIIDHGKKIAQQSGGELHLLHTWQPISGIGAAATRTFKPVRIAVDELSDRMGQEHREKLEALAAANDIDADHMHQLAGRARDVLPYIARERGADLVIMGALARSAVQRMIIGSTAERVLDHLPCDILILRPEVAD